MGFQRFILYFVIEIYNIHKNQEARRICKAIVKFMIQNTWFRACLDPIIRVVKITMIDNRGCVNQATTLNNTQQSS
jgi:hypothetical protein